MWDRVLCLSVAYSFHYYLNCVTRCQMQAMQSNKFTRRSPKRLLRLLRFRRTDKTNKKKQKKTKKSRRKKCSNINYPLYTYLAHNSWSRCIAFHFLLVSLCAHCARYQRSEVCFHVRGCLGQNQKEEDEEQLRKKSVLVKCWKWFAYFSFMVVAVIVVVDARRANRFVFASVWNVSRVCVCVVVMMPF